MRSVIVLLKLTESAFYIQIHDKTLNNFSIASSINCYKNKWSDNFFSKFSTRCLFFGGVDTFRKIMGFFWTSNAIIWRVEVAIKVSPYFITEINGIGLRGAAWLKRCSHLRNQVRLVLSVGCSSYPKDILYGFNFRLQSTPYVVACDKLTQGA